jgi:Tfp pilus assembly protein PilF
VGSHLGGLLAGIVVALGLGLAGQARNERHLEHGLRYLSKAEWFAAQGKFLDYVRLCPQDPDGHLNLARALHLTHHTSAASAAYRKVCEFHAREARFDRVEAVYCEAKRGDASFVLDASLQLQLARLFELTMKPSLAQQGFADFAACYPDHVAAPCALFRAARLAEHTGNVSRAHPFYRRLLVRYPDSIEAGLTAPATQLASRVPEARWSRAA